MMKGETGCNAINLKKVLLWPEHLPLPSQNMTMKQIDAEEDECHSGNETALVPEPKGISERRLYCLGQREQGEVRCGQREQRSD